MAAATPPQSLKERQRQEREQLILRAAGELLLEKGYHETSMEDIAAHVGISKGAVYLHFASKEELVRALMERGMCHFLDALDATLSRPLPPREKLQAVLEQVYSGISNAHYRLFSVAFRSPEFMRQMADRQQKFAALWEGPMQRVAAVFDEGKAAGEFDTEIPTAVMVSMFANILNFASRDTFQRLVMEQGMPLEEVVGYVSHVFFRGIAASK